MATKQRWSQHVTETSDALDLKAGVFKGTDRLNKWVAEKRDVGADFLKVFRDEATTVPPIVGIAVGADADNTQSHSVAYVSGISLE